MRKQVLPLKTRVGFALGFEVGAITLNTVFYWALGNGGGSAMMYSVVLTVLALMWNVAFQTVWQKFLGYPQGRQNIIFSLLYSATFLGIIVPIYMLWMGASLIDSVVANIAGTVLVSLWMYIWKRVFDRFILELDKPAPAPSS